jgi:hypothetical protein
MMGPFLLMMGLLLLYIAAKGKSTDFILALFTDTVARAKQEEKNIGEDLGKFLKYHVWNQLTNAIIAGLPEISVGPVHIGKPQKQPTEPPGGN